MQGLNPHTVGHIALAVLFIILFICFYIESVIKTKPYRVAKRMYASVKSGDNIRGVSLTYIKDGMTVQSYYAEVDSFYEFRQRMSEIFEMVNEVEPDWYDIVLETIEPKDQA